MRIQCDYCDGEGAYLERVPIDYITREQAIESGDPSLEGEPIMGKDWKWCEYCEGRGFYEV